LGFGLMQGSRRGRKQQDFREPRIDLQILGC